MASKFTRIKWQGRSYVVESNENGIVSITHNGFRARNHSRDKVIAAFHKQAAEEPCKSPD